MRQRAALRDALTQLVESCEAGCGSACTPPDAHCAIIGALDGADDGDR